jgi:ribosome-associated protein
VTGPSPNDVSEDDVVAWVTNAARAAASKTDAATVVLDVGDVLSITTWFVVTSGNNARQVRTIADEVERVVAAEGGPRPRRIEGLDALQWVLMDYGDFVVHVFHTDARKYYDLERLWGDVPRLEWQAVGEREAL